MGLNQTTGTLLYVVALFALLYFLMIRPQQQRQKKHQQMLRDIKVNTPIVTAGGIYATVVKIKEDSLLVRVTDGVRIEILKNAVAQVREREETEEKE